MKQELGIATPGAVLATLAIKESISFLEAIFAFMDDFHKHLTTRKFSDKRAHHVTMMLVRRILERVYVPRQGVLATFKPSDPMQVAASMMWSQLSSLQVAVYLIAQGLENLEIVSAELVQFMLVNTQYDSITTLEDETAQLKSDYKEVSFSRKKLEAQLSTANNKILDLVKKVQALEKKLNKS